MKRLAVRAIGLAALAGVAIAVLLAVAHVPAVQSRLFNWGIAQLRARAGIDLRADRISYNLLAQRLDLRGVAASVSGRTTPPFAAADSVTVNLAASTLLGRLQLDEVAASGLRITIVRAADGSLNVPAATGAGGAGLTRLPIGGLRLAGSDVSYEDAERGFSLRASGITVMLVNAGAAIVTGPVAVDALTITAGDIATRARLDGTLAYDGTALSFDPIVYDAPEGQLTARGALASLWSAPILDVSLSGRLTLAELAATLALDPPVHGAVTVEGTVAGPIGAPVASLSLDSGDVAWRHLGPIPVRAAVTLASPAITIDSLSALLDADGTLTATGRFALDGSPTRAHAAWEALPAAALVGPLAPFPLSARLDGEADVEWNREAGLDGLTITADNRSRAGAPARDAIALAGALTFTLDARRWSVRHDHTLGLAARVAGDTSGDLGDTAGPSILEGAVTATAPDLSRIAPILAAAGVELPEWARPSSGRLQARLLTGGTLSAPTLTGDAVVEDLTIAGAGPARLASRLALDDDGVSLDGVEASLGANQASGSVTWRFATGALAASVDLALPDVAEFAAAVPNEWRPSGGVSGRFDVTGQVSQPIVRGRIESAGLVGGGQQIRALSAGVVYDAGIVGVRELRLDQPSGGRLTLDADYTIETQGYVLTATATALDVQPVLRSGEDEPLWPVTAILDGTFEGHGTLTRPDGSGHLTAARLTWRELELGPADVDLALSNETVRVEARFPTLPAAIDATVGLAAPHTFEAVITATDARLGTLVRGLRDPTSPLLALDGQLTGTVRAGGVLDDLAGASVDLDLERADLRMGEARLRLSRPSTVRYASGSLEVTSLELMAGTSVLEASGRAGADPSLESLTVALRGTLADLQPWLTAAGVDAPALDGTVSARVTATGPLDRPAIDGELTVQDGTVGLSGYPAATRVGFAATLRDGLVTATDVSVDWSGAMLRGRLQAPLALLSDWLPDALVPAGRPATAQATLIGRIDGITPDVLAPFAPAEVREALEGTAGLAFDLQSDGLAPDRVTGTITLDELSALVAGAPVSQLRPTRLIVANGRLHVADWTWTASGNRFTVAGAAGLLGDRALDLRAVGDVDLRTLGAFIPGAAAAGVAAVALNVLGTLTMPLLAGTIEIRDGELRVVDPQLAASNVTGRLEFDGQTIRVNGFDGALNGGRLTLEGEVRHAGAALTGGALTLRGTGIAFNVPQGLRTDVNADLTLSIEPRLRISGTVAVQRGAFRQPLSLAAGLLATLRQRTTVTTGPAADSALDGLELDITLTNTEDLLVDNNYGRMDLGFDLRLVGTIGQPSIVGRATIREGGVLYLGGRTYQVERGTVDFTNPRAIVPSLDLTARTRISGYDITLALSGTPETIRADLSSNPALPSQADIVSLLATGRLADQIGGSGTQIAGEQLLGYLSGEALGFAAQAIGVDTLRLERGPAATDFDTDPSLVAGDTDPTARLTVSKALSQSVDLLLSRSLREGSQLTWIVTYTPWRNVELRGVSFDDLSRSYGVRHDVSFGGGTAAAARTAVARAPEPRVGAVQFVGDPGFPTTMLERSLALRPGDRFDFYRWQEDRDRLRRFYLDRHYFEARISARHLDRPGADGQPETVLEYAIARGPLTQLVVEGHVLPGRVRDELDTIWSNAVFDEALFADVRHAVRLYLAEEGRLQARVTVSREVDEGPDLKQILVRVEPGAQTSSRELVFEGRREIPRETLEALAQSTGLGLEAWLDPPLLAREMAATYRQRGFLAVEVSAGPPGFAGDRALLPVRIVEGPPFSVASVTVTGVTARPAAEVQGAFGITAGSRFDPAAVERARRTMESEYARRGFNAMRASVRIEADLPAGTVRLTVEVEEGPQQVLESVALEGQGGVGTTVITGTLQLDPGTPVDTTAWYQARRRLLDTGLFRSVDIQAVPVDETAGPTQPVQARVSLTRWPTWRLRYGISLLDEAKPESEGRRFGTGLSADLQRRGIFGRAGTLGLSSRANANEQIGRVFLTLRSAFGLPVATGLFVSRSRESIEEEGFLSIVTDRTTFTAEQRFNPRPSLRVSYGYQFERNHSYDPLRDPDDVFALDVTTRAARLTSTVVSDFRDDPFNATRGLFHSSAFEYAPSALGSDLRFIKYYLQQFVYRPLAPGVISASAFRLGAGRGFGQNLLRSERFYAGGANTVRGYAENSFGEHDFFGDPAGGQAQLVLNQELRFPIFRWVRGVGFLDAGNVFDRAADLSFGNLRVGAGAGLRVSTPVGLFRLDLGVPVSRDDAPRTLRWHVTFGQMF